MKTKRNTAQNYKRAYEAELAMIKAAGRGRLEHVSQNDHSLPLQGMRPTAAGSFEATPKSSLLNDSPGVRPLPIAEIKSDLLKNLLFAVFVILSTLAVSHFGIDSKILNI